MKIKSKDIALFRNLSQFDFEGNYYDLHNDFNCIQIKIEKGILFFIFRNILTSVIVNVKFLCPQIVALDFDLREKFENLTIDNLYRGKFECKGVLKEFENEKGYFYLEFYEGQKFEFWSESIVVEKQ